jgi:hypothetical protein
MRYELRLTAFDMLDKVTVATVVLEASDIPQVSTQVVHRSVSTVQGTGESDPLQWARDALVAALEDL